jgi:hypothetical protein
MKCLRWLDRQDTGPIILVMRFVLTVAAVWATSIAPQLCRIGVITECCAEDAPQQPVSARADACTPGDCHRDCRPSGKEHAPPAERDCGTGGNGCGASVKAADAAEHTSQLQAKFLAALPAALDGDNRPAGQTNRYPLICTSDSPRLPRPSSDFPLLI